MQLRLIAVASLVALALGCLGPTQGSIAVARLGETVSAPYTFPAGLHLSFAVHAESVSYSGANAILLDVSLTRAGVAVARMRCEGFDADGGAGCQSGVTHANSDCELTVPDGGSDGVRVTATLAEPGDFSFEGLAIYLRD